MTEQAEKVRETGTRGERRERCASPSPTISPTIRSRGVPRGRRCSVYLATANGHLKIGMSANPRSRMASMATASPENVVLEHTWQLPSREAAAQMESALHALFRWARAKREWFSVKEVWARSVGDLLVAGEPRKASRLAHALYREACARAEVSRMDVALKRTRWMPKEQAAALRQRHAKAQALMFWATYRSERMGLEPNEWHYVGDAPIPRRPKDFIEHWRL